MLINVYFIWQFYSGRAGWYDDEFKWVLYKQLISEAVLVLLVAIEAVVYWRIRHHVMDKGWVIRHLILVGLAFVVIPLTGNLYSFWVASHSTAGEAGKQMSSWVSVQAKLFWACYIFAHVCFAIVLIDIFKKRK